MLRITKQADYALVLLSQFANAGETAVRTARELSEQATLPLPSVSKILKALSRNGLLASLRGVNGGYRLARSADAISVADVISAIDGPIAFTDCATGTTDPDSTCLLKTACPTRTHWIRINRVVADALMHLSLAEVARPPLVVLAVPSVGASVPAPAPAASVQNGAGGPALTANGPDTPRDRAPRSSSPAATAPTSDAASKDRRAIEDFASSEYKWGFVSPVEADSLPPGLSEDVIRAISAKKDEPDWLLEWRLKSYRHWLTMKPPTWANVSFPPIDYQDIVYYSAPKRRGDGPQSLEDVDPELLRTYEKLGIPLKEREILAGVAVDAVFDSVSVATTFKDKLASLGIVFCSFSEAVREHPDLVRENLGSVVPPNDNFFAALNSAVFSDGSFCYVPKGVRCPMELSTYFRINAAETGQFERTLIVAEAGAYVSYLEGCTAPRRDVNQLHAAVVELVAHEQATIKYSTVQNWYPGDKEGRGGIYNFVTKRGACRGRRSKISWTQVETGSAITWKYPSCILQGDESVGEFYSVAVVNHHQQADTGTKMVHIGRDTKSTIVSKGISAGRGQNTYRGQVKVLPRAENARNYTQCDSLLLGDRCGAHTVPYIEVRNRSARVEHEASTSRIGEDQLFYCRQRGLSLEDAVNLIVNGFCKQVFRELPMEFAVEAQKLLGVSLEGSVG